MEYRITLFNADEIARAFREAPDVAARRFDEALAATANFVQAEAFKNAPVGTGYKGGGSLRQSIRTNRLNQGSYQVIVGAKYAAAVDQGTRPHVILPRRKRALAFMKDGKYIVTKRVNHPGTKAQPFFTNAVRDAEPFANRQMQLAADDVFNTLL